MSEFTLWCVDPGTIQDQELLAEYSELLNSEESERHRRFYTEKLRHDFLVTRVFVRDVLSRIVSNQIQPSEWIFKNNSYGRPEIANDLSHPLFFNISHTDGLIVCLSGPIYELGVDTEKVTRQCNYLNLASSSFSVPEYEDILQLEPSLRARRFFQYWTLKEAYIKARGMGLSLPLDKFYYEINESASTIRIFFEKEIEDKPQEWNFCFKKPTDNHLMSLAVKTNLSLDQLKEKWIVPLRP